jgi:farnesyl diphosphate synthase
MCCRRISGRPPKHPTILGHYGHALGQAFQIADDLLDVEGDAATVGKSIGKDAAQGKATIVNILGPQGAHARLGALVAEAEQTLEQFGSDAATLRAAARFVAARRA